MRWCSCKASARGFDQHMAWCPAAMSDDIVKRLREKRGVLDNRWPGPTQMDLEAADEIERLRRTLQLHAGDVASLSGELDEWRERALAVEAELRK